MNQFHKKYGEIIVDSIIDYLKRIVVARGIPYFEIREVHLAEGKVSLVYCNVMNHAIPCARIHFNKSSVTVYILETKHANKKLDKQKHKCIKDIRECSHFKRHILKDKLRYFVIPEIFHTYDFWINEENKLIMHALGISPYKETHN